MNSSNQSQSSAKEIRVNITVIPAILSIVPILGAIVCYIIALKGGHVNRCIPPLQGCAYITDGGIYTPESYLFRGFMIPMATIMPFFALLMQIYTKYTINKPIRFNGVLAVLSGIALTISTSLLQGKADTAWYWHIKAAITTFAIIAILQIRFTIAMVLSKLAKHEHYISNFGLFLKIICNAVTIAAAIGTVAGKHHPYSVQSEWWLLISVCFYYTTFILDWKNNYCIVIDIENIGIKAKNDTK